MGTTKDMNTIVWLVGLDGFNRFYLNRYIHVYVLIGYSDIGTLLFSTFKQMNPNSPVGCTMKHQVPFFFRQLQVFTFSSVFHCSFSHTRPFSLTFIQAKQHIFSSLRPKDSAYCNIGLRLSFLCPGDPLLLLFLHHQNIYDFPHKLILC